MEKGDLSLQEKLWLLEEKQNQLERLERGKDRYEAEIRTVKSEIAQLVMVANHEQHEVLDGFLDFSGISYEELLAALVTGDLRPLEEMLNGQGEGGVLCGAYAAASKAD